VNPAGHDDCVRVLDVELCRRIRGEGADERAHPETSEGIDEATDVEQLVAESPRLDDLVDGIEIGLPPGRPCESEGVTEERLKRVSGCCRIGRARDADPTVRQLMCDIGDENVGSQPIEGGEEIRSERIGVGDAPGGNDRAIDPIAEVLRKSHGIERRDYSSVGDLLAVPVALQGGDALPLEAEWKVGQDFDAGRVLQNVVVMPSADRREAYAPAVRPNPTSSDDEVIAIGGDALLLREASGLPTTPDGARPIAILHVNLLASLHSTRAMTAHRLVGHFLEAKILHFRLNDNTQMGSLPERLTCSSDAQWETSPGSELAGARSAALDRQGDGAQSGPTTGQSAPMSSSSCAGKALAVDRA